MNKDIPIVRSVLHPTDFSDGSHRAFAHALAIALLRQAELTVLHVGDKSRDDIDWQEFPQVRATLERWQLLEPGSARSAVLDKLNVRIRKLVIPSRNLIGAVTRFLDQHPHDLVVLATEGSTGSGENWLHRSDAEAIARGTDAKTLFVPSAAKRGFVSLEDGDLDLSNVVVPVDASVDFTVAIELARRAADIFGDGDAVITLLHVGDRLPSIPQLPQGDSWSWRTALRQGETVESILSAADDIDADLVVMATNGRDALRQALAGSTTERVLRRANCPVLAVPEGKSGTGRSH